MTPDHPRQLTGAELQTQFRGSLGSFASGVTVVTTRQQGIDHAMTASAFSSVSLEPPLVLICIDRRNRIHDAIDVSGFWGVSVLRRSAQDYATWLARRGRPLEGQLETVPHHRGEVTGVALVDDAISWLECRTVQSHAAGDHTIVVGEIVSARSSSDDEPLLYFRSHYGGLLRSPDSEKNSGAIGIEDQP